MPRYLSDVDLNGNQLLNAIVQNLASEPTATKGRIFYNTATDKFGVANGTTFDYLGGITVTDLDDVPDSATRLAFLVAERSKLTGIATGATVNSADATLLARANHTGTQLASTISDFSTAADARVVAGITGKANLASPTFTGTVGGITASMVGLGSVDNTSDTAKPVSTAQQTALNLKANLISPTLVTPVLGVASATTINKITITAPATSGTLTIVQGATLTASATATVSGTNTGDQSLAAYATLASPTFTGTVSGITKTMVGLANVDNTTDATKPVSTAQTAADTVAKARANHTGTQLASTISDFSAAADARIQLIVDAAPAALDTLNELAAALGDDPNYAATVTTALGVLTTAVNLRALDTAVCHKYTGLIGTGAATSIVVTHNLNTLYITTSVCQVSDNKFVECDVEATTANTATFIFTVAPATNALRVAVQG